MKRLVRGLFLGLGVLTALVLLAAGGAAVYRVVVKEGVPERVILEVDLERTYRERTPRRGLAAWVPGQAPDLRVVVEALQRASRDDRVRGLVAKVGTTGMDMGKIQEIRDAVIGFRRSGKDAVAWAETFGAGGSGGKAYYLAAAFDRIALQPTGELALTGLRTRTPFLRGLLEEAGVRPRLAKREEYKTAANVLTQKGYTTPHRKAEEALLRSMMGRMRKGIAEGRKLSRKEAEGRIARGPFLAREALEEGLVDRLAYRDEVYAAAGDRAGGGASLLYLGEYLRRAGGPYTGKTRIGLIYGVGRIVRGKSRRSPLGGIIMGSDTVGAAFRAATRDDSVRAIVFRIDSPGGSYVGSDVIRREVARARRAGKPVIVSMSGVAASGGYYAALPADRIIAHPGTLTGSIGVLGGKMITSGLWGKLGVRWEGVSTHENADFWSPTTDYSPEQWKQLQQRLDAIYEDFVSKVGEARGMDTAAVRKAAMGRVWTGEDALELGLVDELGGFPQAVRAAKEAAGIAEEEAVALALFPPRRTLLQWLLGGRPESSEERYAAGADLREVLEAEARFLREAGLEMPDQALWMGPVPAVE